jgi:hypothetical protein
VNYDVRLPEHERDLLRSLRGASLESVRTDGWSAFVGVPKRTIQILPEEVPTPSTAHPHADVNPPRVVSVGAEAQGSAEVIGRFLGRVQTINVLGVHLVFSSPNHAPATEILGVPLPEGVSYGPIFLEKSARVAQQAEGPAALVGLDIAIELLTDQGHTATLLTEAVGHFVHVVLDGGLPLHIAGFVHRQPLEGGS